MGKVLGRVIAFIVIEERSENEPAVDMVKLFCLNCEAVSFLLKACSSSVTAGKAPGGYSQKSWGEVCGPLPKTLKLFMTKICDFCHPTGGFHM